MTENNLHEGVDLEMKMDFGCGYVIRVAGEDRLGGVMSGGDITVDENGFMHISESAIPDLAPSASVNKVGNTTTLSVTDHNGSTSVEIYDGEKGAPGTPGTNGADGEDGFSPIVSVSTIEGGHRVTIIDASGTKSFDVMDGADGASGSSVQKYSGTFSITRDDSEETFNCGFKPDVVFLNANDGMGDTGNVVWYTAIDFEAGEGTVVLTATDTGFIFSDSSSYSLAYALGSNGNYDSVSFLAVKF